jgi:FkbM family methyltransferase
MISFAQNFEDVVLNRLFHDLPTGRYIDVGAEHPISGSVTNHFYTKGWSGINIEPMTSYWNKLVQDRPRDINLNVLIGAGEGEVPFFEIERTGLSTMKTPPDIESLENLGFSRTETTKPMTTLKHIVEKYGFESVEFLKIDVEGAEKEVLEGADFSTFRPKVIVIEAVAPVLQLRYGKYAVPVWDEFEGLLLSNGYCFGLFDGLNRYYYRQESPELADLLSYPACVLDHFQLCHDHGMNGRSQLPVRRYGILQLLKRMFRVYD